jgi:hypothetical protein
MIASLFDTLDTIARFIGWGGMILGLLWVVTRTLQEKRDYQETIADRDAMFRFEAWLEEEHSDRFRSYKDIKARKALEEARGGGEAHWSMAAQEAGVPTSEIIRKR